MSEFDIKVQEILEKKLMNTYKMSFQQFKELDDYTKDKLIRGIYILRSQTKNKDKL